MFNSTWTILGLLWRWSECFRINNFWWSIFQVFHCSRGKFLQVQQVKQMQHLTNIGSLIPDASRTYKAQRSVGKCTAWIVAFQQKKWVHQWSNAEFLKRYRYGLQRWKWCKDFFQLTEITFTSFYILKLIIFCVVIIVFQPNGVWIWITIQCEFIKNRQYINKWSDSRHRTNGLYAGSWFESKHRKTGSTFTINIRL